MPDWLEGNQISVCIKTISDYMKFVGDELLFLCLCYDELTLHAMIMKLFNFISCPVSQASHPFLVVACMYVAVQCLDV